MPDPLSSRLLAPILAVAAGGLVLWACARDGDDFRRGGDPYEDDFPWDTGPDGDDTARPDTADTAPDTADPGDDTSDTGAAYTGTGYDRDDVAYNLVLPDQDGDLWRLYQQDDGPVVLVFGYAQGYNFQSICGWLGDVERDYAAYGVTVAAILFLDDLGTLADEDDAAAWADRYDLPTVLTDPDGVAANAWASSTQVKTYVIGGDMVIRWNNLEATAEEQVRSRVEDLIY